MTDPKPNFQTELARFRQDPRVKLFAAAGLGTRALSLVNLAGEEFEELRDRITVLEAMVADLRRLLR